MSGLRRNLKPAILAGLCVLVIGGSATWIYRTQFAAPPFQVQLHRAVGQVMAEQTARLLGNQGKIVIISIEATKTPELKVQIEEFQAALKQLGTVQVAKTYYLETEGKTKYGVGSGLSARRFVRIVNKNLEADAYVSFVGAPEFSEEELKELKKTPKLVAESRSADKMSKVFQQKILQTAVVSRFTFPAPVEGKAHTTREWFDKHFQVVTGENFQALLGGTPTDK